VGPFGGLGRDGKSFGRGGGYMKAGIAAAVDPGDSPALHAADTLAAGRGLCDPQAVAVLVDFHL